MVAIYRPAWLLLAIPFAAAGIAGVLLAKLVVADDPEAARRAGGYRKFRASRAMPLLAGVAGGALGLGIGIAIALKPHA